MFNKYMFYFLLGTSIVFSELLLGQTTEWRVEWSQNPEDTNNTRDDDILKYLIFRKPWNDADFVRYDSTEIRITNLDTVQADTFITDGNKSSLERGKLYTYKLKAINKFGESQFSETVSAALPGINFPLNIPVPGDTTFRINLDSMVIDHINDDDYSTLDWNFEYPESGSILIDSLEINGFDWVEIKVENLYSTDSIKFIVSDRHGFTDEDYLIIFRKPLTLTLPDTSFQYESHIEYFLDKYIEDQNFDKDSIYLEFKTGPYLNTLRTDSSVIISVKDSVKARGDLQALGSHQVIFSATIIPTNLTVHDTTSIIVKPTINLNTPRFGFDEDDSLKFSIDSLVIYSTYLRYDSSKVSIIPGKSAFLSFANLSDSIIVSADSANWFGRDTISFTYSDPATPDLETVAYFTIYPVNDAPTIANFPQSSTLNPNNNFSFHFNPNDYVSDPDPKDSLIWKAEYDTLVINITQNENDVIIEALETEDSYTTNILFIVSDSSAVSDSANLVIRVEPDSAIRILRLIESDTLIFWEDSSATFSVYTLIDTVSFDFKLIHWLLFREQENMLDSLAIDTTEINSTGLIKFNDPLRKNWSDSGYVDILATYAYLRDTARVFLKILPVNDPPYFTAQFKEEINSFNKEIESTDSFSEIEFLPSRHVYDPDNNSSELHLDWLSRDSNILIDSTMFSDKNIIRFQFLPNWSGSDSLLLRVSDPDSLSDSLGIMLTVLEPINRLIPVGIQAQEFGSSSNIAITWTSEFSARSYVQYGMKDSLNQSTMHYTTYEKSHFHLLENLMPNTEYFYQTVLIDSSNIEFFSDTLSFITGELGDINVFPNPYKAGEFKQNDYINFTGLPENSSVQIFNLLGEPVLRKNEVTNIFRWNTLNSHDKKVQSGLYLYVIKDQDNKKLTSGKLVIIR